MGPLQKISRTRGTCSWVGLVAAISLLLSAGCTSALHEEHFVMSFDPDTGQKNYFRVNIDGKAEFSKAKFSSGTYDRRAINRLFGEMSAQREFEARKLDKYDPERLTPLKDISDQLTRATAAETAEKERVVKEINRAVGRAIGRYEIILLTLGDIGEQLKAPLDWAKEAHAEAKTELDKNTEAVIDKAWERLEAAASLLAVIRTIVEGKDIVYFFDGAGNPIDVENHAMVIFVSTDVSPFTTALRQLTDAEEAKTHLIQAVMGGKIQESQLLQAEVKRSNSMERALQERISTLIENTAKEDSPSTKSLTENIGLIAAIVAGRPTPFANAAEILGFAEGLGP